MSGSPAEGLLFLPFFMGEGEQIMAKIDEVRQCAMDTLARVVSSEEEFRQFLEQGSNLFSYSLTDRLLIYGQKPETTMAASFEDWRDKAGCHVRRGEKGIALFSGDGNTVRYVFSDKSVEPDAGKPMPKRWQFTEENADYVVKSLRETIKAYEYDGELYNKILFLTDAACDAWLNEHIKEEQRREFGDFFKSVVAYEVFTRLGIDTKDIEDYLNFSALHRFRSVKAIAYLNMGIEAVEKPFLQQVRRAVIRFEKISLKEKEHGDERKSDKVRDTEEGISEKSLQRDVSGAALDWGPLGEYLKNSGGSRGSAKEAGRGESKEIRGDGGSEAKESDGVDKTDEPVVPSNYVMGGEGFTGADLALHYDCRTI